MPPRPLLIVMVKEPRPGRVKTRLGREIGMTSAAWWFRHAAAGLLRQVADRRWQVALAVSPDRDGLASRVWPANTGFRSQVSWPCRNFSVSTPRTRRITRWSPTRMRSPPPWK